MVNVLISKWEYGLRAIKAHKVTVFFYLTNIIFIQIAACAMNHVVTIITFNTFIVQNWFSTDSTVYFDVSVFLFAYFMGSGSAMKANFPGEILIIY